MRVSQDERSDDGDTGLQEQFPSTEPDTDPSPNGDRENGLTDEHKEVEKVTIVETVETVVELDHSKYTKDDESHQKEPTKTHQSSQPPPPPSSSPPEPQNDPTTTSENNKNETNKRSHTQASEKISWSSNTTPQFKSDKTNYLSRRTEC